MNLLTITTAEQGAGIAVFNNQTLLAHSYWASSLTHSQRLITMIQDLIYKKADLQLEQIDTFVAAKGPGSFTGLRIGISVTKGLACAMSKPQVGVSSLDGIGWKFAFSEIPVLVMMDARRSEVYSAIYKFSKGSLLEKTPETVNPPEATMASALKYCKDSMFIVAGSGGRIYEETIRSICKDQALFCPSSMDPVCAIFLAMPIFQDQNFLLNPANILTPSYIRSGY